MINTPDSNLSKQHIQFIKWALLGLMPIVGMTIDLVAPVLPMLAKDLHTSKDLAQNIISIYLFGYAIGSFITGFLTDAFGRQRLLRISLVCFILVSLLPIVFPQIEVVLVARLLQGLTIGAIALVLRTILSDILPPENLVHIGTLIGTMWGIGPILGPVIGGYLGFYFGWQACFYFFAIVMAIGFIIVFFSVPETHFNRQPLKLRTIKSNLTEILTDKIFIAITILMGLSYSLIIAFHTIAPFLIQNQLHYSPIFFGRFALYMGLIFVIATFASRSLLKRHSVEHMFLIILNLFFVIALVGFILSFWFGQSIVLIAIISGLMFFATGIIFPTSMGKVLSLFRHIVGVATATMYLINILITSIIGFLASLIHVNSAISLMAIYLVLMLSCTIIYWGIIHRKH